MPANGWCVWFTGLPCSGKTTLAQALHGALDVPTTRLDGDITRPIFGRDLGFSPEDRDTNIERVLGVATFLTQVNKVNVLCSYISPYEAKRAKLKMLIPKSILVYVKCSPEECARRDVKGMWKMAKEGAIRDFTGYSAPYEEPKNVDLVLDTEATPIDECVYQLLNKIAEFAG